MERSSGILMHITSLYNNEGIGTLGEESKEFVDFLEKSGQKYWQVLPAGHTSYGDSPYQAFSSFAGNPYFISLKELLKDGYLEENEIEEANLNDGQVDYGHLYVEKYKLLKKAFNKSKEKVLKGYEIFINENRSWLEDYALFMAIKDKFDGNSWLEWPEDIKMRKDEVLNKYKSELKEEIEFWYFVQFEFYKQWKALKSYANEKGIKIIGDIPIYCAEDSADVWASPKVFKLDLEYNPLKVAGCPPDAFSHLGQLWGNPVYDWEYIEKEDFKWWIDRIRGVFKYYDILRIDHFRGFEAYWEIDYGAKDATGGKWVNAPGEKLFKRLKEEIRNLNIIAEDLGVITDEVRKLRDDCGFPGMKILQFGFSPNYNSDYLPHNHYYNAVIYTGTHDNDTIMGRIEDVEFKGDLDYAKEYLNLTEEEGYNWGFIRAAYSSPCNLAIIPIQDFLGIGKEGRMNTPSVLGGNWSYRVKAEDLTDELADKIKRMCKVYWR